MKFVPQPFEKCFLDYRLQKPKTWHTKENHDDLRRMNHTFVGVYHTFVYPYGYAIILSVTQP